MSYTFTELLEFLKRMDEVSFLEKFGITTEDLVDAFEDRIWDNFDSLHLEMVLEREEAEND